MASLAVLGFAADEAAFITVALRLIAVAGCAFFVCCLFFSGASSSSDDVAAAMAEEASASGSDFAASESILVALRLLLDEVVEEGFAFVGAAGFLAVALDLVFLAGGAAVDFFAAGVVEEGVFLAAIGFLLLSLSSRFFLRSSSFS